VTEGDHDSWAGASEEDEFEVVSMTASRPMTPPESQFCLDGLLDSASEAFEWLTRTNAWMDASLYQPTNVSNAFKQTDIHASWDREHRALSV
jgi:hypothetical protein